MGVVFVCFFFVVFCFGGVLLLLLFVFSYFTDTIRIVDGQTQYSGRLEVYNEIRRAWSTVCYYNFDLSEAEAVCRQLGLYSYR